jgi:hypothetical protein
MCELTRHGMAVERYENGMGAAWARHGMCELALRDAKMTETATNML